MSLTKFARGLIADVLALIGYVLAVVIFLLVLVQNGTFYASQWFSEDA